MEVTTVLTGLFCLASGLAVGVLWGGVAARRGILVYLKDEQLDKEA